jgi:hypothetical protein
MKAFEISGPNGTYLELEDGRTADTVSGEGEELRDLRAQVKEYVDHPLGTYWSLGDLRAYVGFPNQITAGGRAW